MAKHKHNWHLLGRKQLLLAGINVSNELEFVCICGEVKSVEAKSPNPPEKPKK